MSDFRAAVERMNTPTPPRTFVFTTEIILREADLDLWELEDAIEHIRSWGSFEIKNVELLATSDPRQF